MRPRISVRWCCRLCIPFSLPTVLPERWSWRKRPMPSSLCAHERWKLCSPPRWWCSCLAPLRCSFLPHACQPASDGCGTKPSRRSISKDAYEASSPALQQPTRSATFHAAYLPSCVDLASTTAIWRTWVGDWPMRAGRRSRWCDPLSTICLCNRCRMKPRSTWSVPRKDDTSQPDTTR